MWPTLWLILWAASAREGTGCSIAIELYQIYSDVQLMLKSEIVVYGKDANHITRSENRTDPFYPLPSSTSSLSHVYAILKKSEMDIPSQIEIRRIFPRSTCSGTKLKIGDEYIFMLRHTDKDGVFDLDEVNAHQSAAVIASSSSLYEAVRTCGLNDVRPPDGQTPPPDPELWWEKLMDLAREGASDQDCVSSASSWRSSVNRNLWTSRILATWIVSVAISWRYS